MSTDGALEIAYGALRHRDLSRRELEDRLSARGFREAELAEACERLTRIGLLDDRRFADGRARTLAGRGAGDDLIRATLANAGVASEVVEEALSTLEPETDRAHRIVERRGPSPKTSRYLAGKGFSAEVIRAAVADEARDTLR